MKHFEYTLQFLNATIWKLNDNSSYENYINNNTKNNNIYCKKRKELEMTGKGM